MGAKAIELELETLEGAGGYAREMTEDRAARQRDLLAPYIANADGLITTAAVPGRRAPILVTAAMVEQMRPGSVVVDLAAESGGNVEGSEPGEIVRIGNAQVWGFQADTVYRACICRPSAAKPGHEDAAIIAGFVAIRQLRPTIPIPILRRKIFLEQHGSVSEIDISARGPALLEGFSTPGASSILGEGAHRGETLALLGESGCGKSMTATALIRRSSRRVAISGTGASTGTVTTFKVMTSRAFMPPP